MALGKWMQMEPPHNVLKSNPRQRQETHQPAPILPDMHRVQPSPRVHQSSRFTFLALPQKTSCFKSLVSTSQQRPNSPILGSQLQISVARQLLQRPNQLPMLVIQSYTAEEILQIRIQPPELHHQNHLSRNCHLRK